MVPQSLNIIINLYHFQIKYNLKVLILYLRLLLRGQLISLLVLVWGPHLVVFTAYLEITLDGLRRPNRVFGNEPRLDMCKASDLPGILFSLTLYSSKPDCLNSTFRV